MSFDGQFQKYYRIVIDEERFTNWMQAMENEDWVRR